MFKVSIACLGLLLLTGCVSPPKDLEKTVETGQQILQNENLKNAGGEVLTGGKEILDTGTEAAVHIGAGAQKVLAGGKVILAETQEIINQLQAESDLNPQPEDGDTVWVRTETAGCWSDEPCFAWRPDQESPWQLLQGHIANLDELPAQIDNWKVQLSALADLANGWEVAEIVTQDGQ